MSAGGKFMLPFALFHGPPDKYEDDYDESLVRCYGSKKGYAKKKKKKTFDAIMRTLFVPYVKTKRTYGCFALLNEGR